MDVRHALVDASLVEVGDQNRDLELPNEEQCELACHQASTDDANLGDGLREGLIGGADGPLGTLLNEIEGIHRCGELVTGDQASERFVLARKSLGLRAGLRLVEQV